MTAPSSLRSTNRARKASSRRSISPSENGLSCIMAQTQTAPVSGDDDQLARHVAEAIASGVRHGERLRDRNAPFLQPNAGLDVEAHARLQNRLIAGTQADRALAPIRRIGQADRIADAAFLLESVAAQDRLPDGFDVFGRVARPRRSKAGVDAFHHGFGDILNSGGRLAEMDRAGEWRMIAA